MARRRLDAELVRRHIVASRSAAQDAIASGRVEVDGLAVTKPSSQVDDAVSIRIVGDPPRFVSRGGLKLAAALDSFPVDVVGRAALDAGASTGGFTDCLLQAGAASVTAVDVGYGQLDWKIRQDERVLVLERVNVRNLDLASAGGPFGVVVADLSFISLCVVAPALEAAGDRDADWILLVKPQFEVGKELVGKGGIVRDPNVRMQAVLQVVAAFAQLGVGAAGVIDSPISGAKGNREFLVWLRRGATAIDEAAIGALEGTSLA